MSVEEAILRGQQLKEEGNAAFKAGNIGEACVKYEELAVTLEKDDVYDGANVWIEARTILLRLSGSLHFLALLFRRRSRKNRFASSR